MTTRFKLAVLSDLHAAPKSSGAPAGEVKLFTDQDGAPASDHPMAGLRALIHKEQLSADVVVCPGDMTNRADAQALSYVWKSLHDVASLLGTSRVIATVGNHDIDSRGHSPNSFPRESLMRLAPPFPASDVARSNGYWAHGYHFEQIGPARFLVLNTCWLHESRDELERGVVTDYTLERIASELASSSPHPINIAVCHHHPHPHTELRLGFDDVIRNGQKLLDALSENGSWMVVHGHKHHPKIEYAQGQYRQAVVLACGSFSGRLEGDNALVSKNYFHLLELDTRTGRIAGQITSWNWIPGYGWRRYSSSPPAFPTLVGFGCRTDLDQLADQVRDVVNGSTVSWAAVIHKVPELQFVMPKQLGALIDDVRARHRIRVVFDEWGLPAQVGPEISHA
jgi:3',5'-cyclic AMP phosphodiesterase CpdA